MAQTRRRRRRKHRGTQGGGLDRGRARGRPRTRQEARSRAKKQMGQKRDRPPSWSSAVGRGAIGAGIFCVLLIVLFGRPPGPSLGLATFMFLIYIPMGYYIERFFWSRRQRAKRRPGD